MKKYTFPLIAALSIICLLFTSCSSTKQNTAFSERKYYNFKHHAPVVAMHFHRNNYSKNMEPKTVWQNTPVISEGKTFLAANPAPLKTDFSNIVVKRHTNTMPHNTISNSLTTNNETVYEYSRGTQQEQATTKGSSSSTIDPVVLVILAIFVSPLAVYLYDNAATTRFWIDLLLWVFGVGFFGFLFFFGVLWLVAVIYAILIVTGSV